MKTNWIEQAISLNKQCDEIGFRWENAAQILTKIHSEILEVKEALEQQESQKRIREEIGDLMFAVTSLACFLKIDPEQAFTDGITKFEKRFELVLEIFKNRNIASAHELSSKAIIEMWEEAKAREN